MSSEALNFVGLVQVIQHTHASFASQASKAVNISLTLRNWFIGHHIAEFELHGADRAGYGDRLLEDLSCALRDRDVSSTGRRQLYGYLRFYRSYPQIVRTASALFGGVWLFSGARTRSADAALTDCAYGVRTIPFACGAGT